MRRFTISYRHKQNVEGCLFSDGTIYLHDNWIPTDEWTSIAHLLHVVGKNGEYPVILKWIDEQPAQVTL